MDFKTTAKELYRVLVPGGVVCWDVRDQIIKKGVNKGSVSLESHRQALYFVECGFRCHEIIVIQKVIRTGEQQVNRHGIPPELVYVFSKGAPRTFNPIMDRPNPAEYVGKRYRSHQRSPDGEKHIGLGSIVKPFGKRRGIWKVSQYCPNDYTGIHPARMQECLARDLIVSYSNPGDTILDPMMGVGTTPKMALLNHRHFIGFEPHKPYFDVAKRRMDEAWVEYLKS